MTTLPPPRPLSRSATCRVELGGRPILAQHHREHRARLHHRVIGLNGSGKTTLLRALVNEYPHKGTIQFHCGHDHSRAYPEAIGYVPQR